MGFVRIQNTENIMGLVRIHNTEYRKYDGFSKNA